MTQKEFYEFLATATGTGTLDFGDSIQLRIGPQDALAAKLLLWLADVMPDDATLGQMDDALDAAKWWMTLFASIPKEGAA